MIVTQTPLRLGLLGGGTDLWEFWRSDEGRVLSMAIDKYVYVIAKERFDDNIRVGYTRTELVERVEEVEHDLVRESLRITGVGAGIEIATMADIPSRGSGLGSSSSVTVGLLHALWTYRGELPTRRQLAEEAYRIEHDLLHRPVGVQDQYAVAFGGLNHMTFGADAVRVEPAVSDPAVADRLGERLMLFYTGVTRQAQGVLAPQRAAIERNRARLRRMAEQAAVGRELLRDGRFDDFGLLLGEAWQLKRGLDEAITTPAIDRMYDRALEAGAVGGKLAGAGGGGFLLVYCPPERQADVRAALAGVRELEFRPEREGSLVLMHSRRR